MMGVVTERQLKARREKGISTACKNGEHEHCFEMWCNCSCHTSKAVR